MDNVQAVCYLQLNMPNRLHGTDGITHVFFHKYQKIGGAHVVANENWQRITRVLFAVCAESWVIKMCC